MQNAFGPVAGGHLSTPGATIVTAIIYHNPRCSKSRQALELLRERGMEPRVVEYLKTPPDAATLRGLLRMLGCPARDLLRRGEEAYAELGLAAALEDNDAVIAAMVEHPALIERPVVVVGERAVIGRPPEKLLTLLAGAP
jgi:arsenate reductase (glutaredoxin)